MDFNIAKNVYVFFRISDSKFHFFDTDEDEDVYAELYFLGIAQAETGYKVEIEQMELDTENQQHALVYKMDAVLEFLVKNLHNQYSDSGNFTLFFIDADTYNFNQFTDGGDAITDFDGAESVILRPMPIEKEEDQLFGTGKVRAVRLAGMAFEATKVKLRKNVSMGSPPLLAGDAVKIANCYGTIQGLT